MRADDDYIAHAQATAVIEASAAAVHPAALADALAFLAACRPDLIPTLIVDDRIEDRDSLLFIA